MILISLHDGRLGRDRLKAELQTRSRLKAGLHATNRLKAELRAFSLLEIMVAVSLLAFIVAGLLGMFYQTEKAFRIGTRQADVLETGRSLTDMLARELQEMAAVPWGMISNYWVNTPYSEFLQNRPGWVYTNRLQEYFFVSLSNDVWIGTGYYIDDPNSPVGTLYRCTITTNSMPEWSVMGLFDQYRYQVTLFENNNNQHRFRRVADNVMSLRLSPYDTNGVLYSANLNPAAALDWERAHSFANQWALVPAYIDIELAILEPRILDRVKGMADAAAAANYLKDHAEKVHIFRQRVVVRGDR